MTQLIEALRYNPEGIEFDSLWGHWNGLNPSASTMTLKSNQPLTKISTKNIFLGVNTVGV